MKKISFFQKVLQFFNFDTKPLVQEKTLSQTLAENLAYYVNDTSKRCVDGGCYYSGKTIKKDTDGCFVGRFLTPENRLRADNAGIGSVEYLVKRREQHNINVPDIIKDNVSLFTRFQVLHDENTYWGENCLNSNGKQHLKETISRFHLDEKDFEKFL